MLAVHVLAILLGGVSAAFLSLWAGQPLSATALLYVAGGVGGVMTSVLAALLAAAAEALLRRAARRGSGGGRLIAR